MHCVPVKDIRRLRISSNHNRYRPEIDGLRALAVLPVILFHAGFKWFSGGYIGVDIFFVISGYLITTIILKEKTEGTFSITGFYERRARRILPALFFIMFACLIPAWLWMVPHQLEHFSKSIVSVVLFISNIFFWRTSGYFDDAAEEKPLLHTWSLGVEEQYYLFFPILVILLWRVGVKRLTGIVFILALMSLALSEWGWRYKPMASFYLLFTRAWELLIGSLLAFAVFNKPLYERAGRITSEILSTVGLALIVISLLIFDKSTPFPSLYALLPTGGAALILGYANENTVVARLLSLKWIAGIGLISYSAYLWHQPLFSFARILTLNELSKIMYFVLISVTVLLAYFTWKYIETPFRKKEYLQKKGHIFLFSILISLSFVMLGGFGIFNSSNQDLYVKRVNTGLSAECEFTKDFVPISACVTSSEPKVLVWGDSYAMHLVPGLLSSNPEIELAQATRSLCGPFLNLAPIPGSGYGKEWAGECLSFNQSVLNYIAAQKSIEVVVLSSPFDAYVSSNAQMLQTSEGAFPASVNLAFEKMSATIDAVKRLGKQVVIVAPPPSGGFNMGDCAERLLYGKPIYGKRQSCDFKLADYKVSNGSVEDFLNRIESDVKVVRFEDIICDDTECRTTLDAIPIFRDSGHFSYGGSEYIGLKMKLHNQIVPMQDRLVKQSYE
jgi:peptidoglycan/LPS O-acetylase OafA/YrhL